MTTSVAPSSAISGYVSRLRELFRSSSSKHEAHARSREVVAEIARDPRFLAEALERHVGQAANLNRCHYPVLALEVESNPDFDIVFNCWIPLPDRATDISTKAIHHHGPMLLTTGTVFGPGYEHWMLRRPEPIDPTRDLFRMDLIDHGQHGLHQVAFVDAYTAHVPIYPESLTITVCLWSNSAPTTWRDRLKRVPVLQRHSSMLRRLATRARLAKQLDLKVDDYKDYRPGAQGFVGMKDREEFPHTSNEDYLYSLFSIIQETGNSHLASVIERHLDRGARLENASLIRRLVQDLKSGTPIHARLSPEHYGVPHANFSTTDIERALAAQD
jgi:hypothetical protein